MDIMMEPGEAAMAMTDENIEDIVNKIVKENIGNDEILITKNLQIQDQENHQTPPTSTSAEQNHDRDSDSGYQNYEKSGQPQTTIDENHDVDDVVDQIVSDIIVENDENDIQIQIKSSVDILEDHDHSHHQKPDKEYQSQSDEIEKPCNQEANEIGGLICANCYCIINRKEDCRLFSEQLFLSTPNFNTKSACFNENGGGSNVTILEAILEIYESKWSVNFKSYNEYQDFTSSLYMCWNCLFILANLYKLFKEFQSISASSNSLIEKYINLTTKLDDTETNNKHLKRPHEESSNQENDIKLIKVSSLAPGQNNGNCQRVSTESGNSSADQLFDDFQKYGGEEYEHDGDNNISIEEKFIAPSIQEESHQNPASNNNYFNSYGSSSNFNQHQERNRNIVEISNIQVQDSYNNFMDQDNNYQDPYGELNNIMTGIKVEKNPASDYNNAQSNNKGNNSNRYDQQPSTSTSQNTGLRRGRGRPRKCKEECPPVKAPPRPRNEDSDVDPDFTLSSDSEEIEEDDSGDSEWSESGSYKSKNSSTKRKGKGSKRRRNSSTEKKFVPPKPLPPKRVRSVTLSQEDIFNRPGILLPRKYQKHPPNPNQIEPQLNMANNQVKLFHLQQVKQLLNNRSQLSIHKSGQVGGNVTIREHKYNCKSPNCTSIFNSYMSLQEHIKLEDEKFPNRCKYCFWPYKTLQSKDTHERKYHTNAITIGCEFCKQIFVKIEEIFLHLDSTHRYSSGEYFCSLCNLYYSRGWSLLMHFMAPSHKQQESLLEASVNKIEVTPTIVNKRNNFISQVPPTNITISSDINNYFGNTNQNHQKSSSMMKFPHGFPPTRTTRQLSTPQGKNKIISPDSSISITPILYQNQNSSNSDSNKSITITPMSSSSINNSQSPAGQTLPSSSSELSGESPMEMQTLIKKIQMDMEANKMSKRIPDLKPLPPDS